MPRQANAIDFWRGIALVTIFINHVPGMYYARFTHANYSFSDSADLFVFLAGWSMRYLIGAPGKLKATWYLVLRLWSRALELYAAQILITMIAIAMLAASATMLDNPLLLEWHNAAAVFFDPILTHIGLAALTHHLGYFDILPLYVVLMAVAPVFAIVDRYAPNWLLPLSLALYFTALSVPIPVPSWPVDGQWFFNPLAWQLVFVLGFVMARPDGVGGVVRRHIVPIRWLAVPIVAVSAYIVGNGLWPDPTRMPRPVLLFISDKTYVTPMRVIQFLALIALVSVTYPYILRFASWLVEFFSMLGRNSLIVFCVGSLLSLAGQIARFVYRGDIVVDTIVVILGIAIMAFSAWLPEWREQVRSKRLGTAVAGILIAGLVAVSGEEAASPAPSPAPTATVPVPAPLSPECQSGTTEIVSESPLPNVAAALQKRRTVRILAIGSSGGRRQGGYTHRIERILKQVLKGADVVIINRGVSGELAANATLRIKNEVAITTPDLVIWQVGTNDALAFVPLDEFAESVEKTIRWLKEHNVDVVLAGLQYVERVSQDEHYYRMRELLREIAAKENVMIIRRYEAMQFIAAAQGAGGGYDADEFERTGAGYNCLAQYLASAITLGAFGKGMSGRPLRSHEKQQQSPPK